MLETRVVKSTDTTVLFAAGEIIRKGGIIAFPTDTVYGLGADVFNPQAVHKLYMAKGRGREKAIPVLGADLAMFAPAMEGLTPNVRKLAEVFWPGPLTILVRKNPRVPEEVSSYPTVGLRIPDLPLTLELLRQTGPLAVTSANVSGEESLCTSGEVYEALNRKIHLLVDGGRTPGGTPSTVVDCSGEDPVLLRKGPVSLAEIRQVLGIDLY